MRPKPGVNKSSLPCLSGAHDNSVTCKGTVYRLEVIPRKGRGGLPWGEGGLRMGGSEDHVWGNCGGGDIVFCKMTVGLGSSWHIGPDWTLEEVLLFS